MSHSLTRQFTKSVIVLLADGARPDTLAARMSSGDLPAMSRLASEGALYTATTVFPSVTGPAYTPFLFGRFPGPLGLPGLRWYDRSRSRCSYPHYTRSYLSADMRLIDADVSPEARSIFQLVPSRLGSLCMFPRGLSRREYIGGGLRFALRAAATHLLGSSRGWLEIDSWLGRQVVERVKRERPAFTFAAFTGVDKTSHESGHDSSEATGAMRIVDDVVAELRHDAERCGEWESTQLWVVSDHGHSPVVEHDDLARFVRSAGHRVISHPWVYGDWDAAVMVSGNAMAHVYLERGSRVRRGWSALEGRRDSLCDLLLERPSVDLLVLPEREDLCYVRGSGGRGTASVSRRGRAVRYDPLTGDPLGLGDVATGYLEPDEAWELCSESPYPDSLVQIASLGASERIGDIVASAAPGYDFRANYEPIPHVSTHGALHREHMLVPVLASQRFARRPLRTVDLMPSALGALEVGIPGEVEGVSRFAAGQAAGIRI